MGWMNRLWNTCRDRSLSRDLEDELQHHLRSRSRDLEKAGLCASKARQQATLCFGNTTLQKERMRDMNVTGWLSSLYADLRYAVRQSVANPGFAAMAILSLAIGIGANTALFSVFNAALLRSLPVDKPEELVLLTNPNNVGVSIGLAGGERGTLSYAEFQHLRDHVSSVSGMCASQSQLDRWQASINGAGQEEVRGRLVTEEYFNVFGVKPLAGRVFTAKDATGPGADPYAVISFAYWQRRFGANPSVLGTTIRISNASVKIIGIAPRSFHGESAGDSPDLWLPMMMQPLVMPGRDWLHEDLSKSMLKVMWLQVFGRMKPGANLAQVQAESNTIFHALLENTYPKTIEAKSRNGMLDQRLALHEAAKGVFGDRDRLRQQLSVLMSLAGLVLLVACANVANLLLARASARQREFGVRISLGAARGRILRQLLTESMLLAFAGGAVGLGAGIALWRVLTTVLSTPREPLQLATGFDWRVLMFAIGISAITGLLFGLAPAVRTSRSAIYEALKEGGRSVTESNRGLSLGKWLVITQVGLSLLLLVGSGLFLRTLWNLQSVSVGYEKNGLLQLGVDAVSAGYKDMRAVQVYKRISEQISSVPGVRAVTYSQNGLFAGGDSGTALKIEGFASKQKDDNNSRFDSTGPGYFASLGIPVRLGREFSERDMSPTHLVCIVNQAFVHKFFAGRNPIGKHIQDTFGGDHPPIEIVGVVPDIRSNSLQREINPRFYVPAAQGMGGIPQGVNFDIRTVGDPRQFVTAVRKAILTVDGDLPIRNALTLNELLDANINGQKMIATLCAAFGLIALILAGTGIYGILAYGVARRTNEIGIRMALGADKSNVVSMVLRETAILIGVGVIAGVLATMAFARLITSSLYGLSAMDPLTIATSVALLSIVALLASAIPAVRAAGLNPVSALRHE